MTKPRKDNNGNGFALPDWIDPMVWQEFERMRTRLRKPLTEYAKTLIVRKLEAARSYCDPNECLNESIERDWLTVYPKKKDAQPEKPDEPERKGVWARRL